MVNTPAFSELAVAGCQNSSRLPSSFSGELSFIQINLGQYYKKGIGQSDFSSFPFSGPLEKQNGLQTTPGSDKRDACVNIS